MADDAHAFEWRTVIGQPIPDQLVEDRIQLLFGRAPRLDQVVVQPDRVDGTDGGVDVRVSRQEDALGVRKQLQRLLQELHARHLGHAVVREEHGDVLLGQPKLAQDLERGTAGFGAHHSKALRVLAAQVAGYGLRDRGIIVDCQ